MLSRSNAQLGTPQGAAIHLDFRYDRTAFLLFIIIESIFENYFFFIRVIILSYSWVCFHFVFLDSAKIKYLLIFFFLSLFLIISFPLFEVDFVELFPSLIHTNIILPYFSSSSYLTHQRHIWHQLFFFLSHFLSFSFCFPRLLFVDDFVELSLSLLIHTNIIL